MIQSKNHPTRGLRLLIFSQKKDPKRQGLRRNTSLRLRQTKQNMKKTLSSIARGLGHVGGARFWSSMASKPNLTLVTFRIFAAVLVAYMFNGQNPPSRIGMFRRMSWNVMKSTSTCGFCPSVSRFLCKKSKMPTASPCALLWRGPWDCRFVHTQRRETDRKLLSKALDASLRLNPLQTTKSSEWNFINKSMRHYQSSQSINQQTFYFPMPWWRKSPLSRRCGLLQNSLWSLWNLRSLRAWSTVATHFRRWHCFHTKLNGSKKLHRHRPRLVLSARRTQKTLHSGVREFHCIGGNQFFQVFWWCKASYFKHWFRLTSAAPSIFSRNGWKKKATNVWPTSAQCLWHRQGCCVACVFHDVQWHVVANNFSTSN